MIKNFSWLVGGLLSVVAMNPYWVHAEDSVASSIRGAGIELFEKDHAFAGSIAGAPVFGTFSHSPFSGRIEIRKGESILALDLSMSNTGVYGGEIIEKSEENGSVVRSTHISLSKIEKWTGQKATYHIEVNGQNIDVDVAASSFENNHFQQPVFSTSWNGKPIGFKFSGESCYAYSANIIMLILGAYIHLGQ